MESAEDQLARPLTALSYLRGTVHPSRGHERLSVTYMRPWPEFIDDVKSRLHGIAFAHLIPLNDETEPYQVGSELGVTGRFVRNVCDPVVKAITPLPGMARITFADVQALACTGDVIPDVSLGLIQAVADPANILMVGEIKTPWTTYLDNMRLNRPNEAIRLEPLMGQVVQQMREAGIRYAFLSTYIWTIFVKRDTDTSFLLSDPFRHNVTGLSVREMFAGFSLLASDDPRYDESPDFNANTLRGAPALQLSTWKTTIQGSTTAVTPNPVLLSTVTNQSLIVDASTSVQVVLNVIYQISSPRDNNKAVYAAELNGKRVIVKCWSPKLVDQFETEAAVYERISQGRYKRHDLFAQWILWGEIVCSSLFPVGYVLVLEEIEGARLSDIWHNLTHDECSHVKAECRRAINQLRAMSLRLDDAGMHNVLFSQRDRRVTMIDFEDAVECEPNTFITTNLEMNAIFGMNFT
ncbi:hypothetical protein PITC_071640 [Penicillium italicum]|uniref:Protein kinase domain-containing protein n=1 Tax=Penicillium italicum TaxID=40296 RepID=A0A0A2LMY0_PENIT|nr:hypothetical protein PITC_071640 [Penicillium italicum]